MRLEIDLSALEAAVRQMGTAPLSGILGAPLQPVDQIDYILTTDGVPINLDEVTFTPGGLIEYQGRQILLYIQDQGLDVAVVLQDGSKGRKFHVAHCNTLKEMRQKGRYERYVQTNSMTQSFLITGADRTTRRKIDGYAELRVCKNCLKAINYNGAVTCTSSELNAIVEAFKLQAFFEKYSTHFPYPPMRMAGDSHQESYSTDWKTVSEHYRTQKKYRCEKCKMNLNTERHLLHVHHKNGVKSDNSPSNLVALCAACHRDEPMHEHIYISHDNMKSINHLRREQGILDERTWEATIAHCDSSLRDGLDLYRRKGGSPPCVGHELLDVSGRVICTLDVAWPEDKRGIVISRKDYEAAKSMGWHVQSMFNAISQLSN